MLVKLIIKTPGRHYLYRSCVFIANFDHTQILIDVYDESYENLLNRSDDISIHQKHLRYLAIELYKSLTMLNPGFMWNFFERNHIPYNLRRGDLLLLPPAKSTRCGVN